MSRPLICADADGVVAVPAAEAGRITETAERIEVDIVAAALADSTLRAARETFGYHVELAEIPHSGHWPMYANPIAMRDRIAAFTHRDQDPLSSGVSTSRRSSPPATAG